MKRLLFPLAFLLFILAACGASDENKIRETLSRREEALRKKDLSLYLTCISEAYRDKDEDVSRIKSRIDGYFRNFDRINYSSWDRSIQIDGREAAVVQQFHLEVEKGDQKHRHGGKEALFLRKEGGQWKIIRGL